MWEKSPCYLFKWSLSVGLFITLTLADSSRYDKQVTRSKRDLLDAKSVGNALYEQGEDVIIKREEIPIPPTLNAVQKDVVVDPDKETTTVSDKTPQTGDIKSTINNNERKSKDNGSTLRKKYKTEKSRIRNNGVKTEKRKKDKDQKKLVQSRGDVQKKEEDESLIKDDRDSHEAMSMGDYAVNEDEGGRLNSKATQQVMSGEQQNTAMEEAAYERQNGVDNRVEQYQQEENMERMEGASNGMVASQQQNQEAMQNMPTEISKRSRINKSEKPKPLSHPKNAKRFFPGSMKQIFDKLYNTHHSSQNHKQNHANTYNIIDQRPGLMRRKTIHQNKKNNALMADKSHGENEGSDIMAIQHENSTEEAPSGETKEYKKPLHKHTSGNKLNTLQKKAVETEIATKRFCMDYHDSCCHEMCPPRHVHHVHHHHRHIHHEDHQIVLHRPGVIYHPAPTVVHRPDIIIHRPPLLVHRPVIVVHQPPVILHRPPVYYKQPDVIFHTPHSIVREPTIYSHDIYTHVPHLQQVDSRIENHELTTHIGEQCGGNMGESHGFGCNNGVQGESYHDKGVGDYYNTEKYGEMGGEEGGEEDQDDSRSAISNEGDKSYLRKEIDENNVKRLSIPLDNNNNKNIKNDTTNVNGTIKNVTKRQEISRYSPFSHGIPRFRVEPATRENHSPIRHRHHRHLHVGEQNIVLHRPGVIYHPSPTVVHRPIIVIHRPPLLVHRPSIVVHQPPVVIHRPPVYYKQPDVVFHTPPPEVHEPMYQSHDLYKQVPRLEHINSRIEKTETLVHPMLNHGEQPIIAENHSDDMDLSGYHMQGEHYHGKGLGDIYGTENYGDIKPGNEKETTGASRSYLPFNFDKEYDMKMGNDNIDSIDDTDDINESGATRDTVTHLQDQTDYNTDYPTTSGDEQAKHLEEQIPADRPEYKRTEVSKKNNGNRKRRSTLHASVSKHKKRHHSNARKRNNLSKKHRIVVSRPDIIYHQPPEVVHRPPIIVHRPDIIVHRPSILIHRPAVVVHRPAIAYHQPPVIFSTPNPIIERQTAVSHDMFVQHNVPQQVSSRMEHVGSQAAHMPVTGHTYGVGHDIGHETTFDLNAPHAGMVEEDSINDHGELQGEHGEAPEGQLIQGDLLQGDVGQAGQADTVQGEMTHGQLQHGQGIVGSEYVAAGGENIGHEAEVGEATQGLEQAEGVHQGDGMHQGMEPVHQGFDPTHQGVDSVHHGVESMHQGMESFAPYPRFEYDPVMRRMPMMSYHPSFPSIQGFSPMSRSNFYPVGGIMGMESPVHSNRPWTKSNVPSHKGHTHKRKLHHSGKVKHIKGAKKSGGLGRLFGGGSPHAGFSFDGNHGGCGNGGQGCIGPEGIGGCGILHGREGCGDHIGGAFGDSMNNHGIGENGGGDFGSGFNGDHNAGCIESCNEHDTHQCCGSQSTVLYRPDVIFHPRPELYHRPDIIVHRPDVVIHRPSVVIHQPPVLVHRPAVIVHQPPIIFHQPAPEIRRPQLVSHDQYVTHAVPERVGSEIHHTGNIIAHGGYYDSSDSGHGLGGIGGGMGGGIGGGIGGAIGGSIGGGVGGGINDGNGGGIGGGMNGGGMGGGGNGGGMPCGNGADCGTDQHTNVNEIPQGLDGAHEAVHFDSNIGHGGDMGHNEMGGGCSGGSCGGGAFGKSQVESPGKEGDKKQGKKVSGKDEKPETKELKKESKDTEKDKKEEKKEVKKHSKGETKIVKRATEDSSKPREKNTKKTFLSKSTTADNKLTAKSDDGEKSKRDCYEAHNTHCHSVPGHVTVIHRPDVIFHQRPEIIHRPDIVVHRPDVVIHRPDVVIHRPSLVVHKPPMVIKQSPIVFHQEHPVIHQPVHHEDDMYVTHDVPLQVGSHVQNTGNTEISNGCHYQDGVDGCTAPAPYMDHTDDIGGMRGMGGGIGDEGHAGEYNGIGGSDCEHGPYSNDCGGMKKTKVAKKHKSSRVHEKSVTGSKRHFEESGHGGGGGHEEGFGEGGHGIGGGGHEGGGGHDGAGGGYGWHGGFDGGHGGGEGGGHHGNPHHFDFDHGGEGGHEGGSHGHDEDWDHGDSGHGHGDSWEHHGDHMHHHAYEQNIIVQRPDIVFHPRPELYHRPDIIVHRPDIVIHRPSVVIHQPPVLVHRPAVIYHQPPVVFHQPGPVVHRPRVVSHDMYVSHNANEQVGSQIEHAGGDFVGHGGYYEGHDINHGDSATTTTSLCSTTSTSTTTKAN